MEKEFAEPLLKNRELIVIRYVDSSMSKELLCKFPDYSGFGFDYSQSAIWSPLVPRVNSLSCLNAKSPELRKKISFDDDDGDDDCVAGVACNGIGRIRFSGFKKKVCAFGSKLNDNLLLKRKKKKNKSRVCDFNQCSSPSSKKGWKKALKITSKQFKKKKEHQVRHNPSSRITLADYLQCQNL